MGVLMPLGVVVVLVGCGVGIAACISTMFRALLVLDFRLRLIDMIARAAEATPGTLEKRIDKFKTVGNYEMVLKFWKPLDALAWYDDVDFLL